MIDMTLLVTSVQHDTNNCYSSVTPSHVANIIVTVV